MQFACHTMSARTRKSKFLAPERFKGLCPSAGVFQREVKPRSPLRTVRRRKLALFLLASDTKKTGERIVAFVARELEHSFVGSLER